MSRVRVRSPPTSHHHLTARRTTTDQIPLLKAQIQELHAQFFPDAAGPFKDNPDSSSPASSASPPPLEQPVPQRPVSKSVRFTDDTADPSLGPYHDEPPAEPEYDHSDLDNVGIHQDHARIMCDQDTQLDRLGESIGRQHQLSIQIGDELESQVDLLDDVDDHTDRSQSRLNRASRRLGRLRTSASKERSGMMTIVGLIIILVVLIVILK